MMRADISAVAAAVLAAVSEASNNAASASPLRSSWSTVIVTVLAVAVVVGFIYLLDLRRRLQRGAWIKQRSIRYRRWYCPGKTESIETLQMIQKNMRDVSVRSVGTVLKYPTMNAESDEELRAHMSNKIIMEIAKGDKVVAFHMAFLTDYPHAHLGLVMVDNEFRGHGLQQFALLNMGLLCLDWFTISFYVTDIGYSSSGWRLLSTHVYKIYPNLYYDVKPEPFHYEIADLLLSKYRADIGVSSKAVFDPKTFVVKGSNTAEGGGAAELVNFASTRVSRSSVAQRILEELMEEHDEQLYVGHPNLLVMLYRLLPLESITLAVRWAVVISLMAYHTIIPDLSWYYMQGFRMFGFELLFVDRKKLSLKPAIWICNHYHWLDLWACKILNPMVSVVVKSDLVNESPPGWKRECFRIAFQKLRFIAYKRGAHDTQVRDQMKKVLLEDKRPILVYAEGTSQRAGPPLPMYGGSIEIARECNVPIQPICVRYNLPIGLDKKDEAMPNAFQVIRLSGKKLAINILPEMENTATMEEVRAKITEGWHAMKEILDIPDGVRSIPTTD